jgi:hypothetical protein
MRQSLDVLRSLGFYTAQILGPVWDVRWSAEQGTFSRPSAVIQATTTETVTAPRATLQESIQSFTVQAFVEPGEGVAESLVAAHRVAQQLTAGFSVGQGLGRAARVPLWNYDAVPWDEGSTARNRPDYAQIRDLQVDPRQNPSDELLFTVVVNMRLRWFRNGEQKKPARILRDIRTTITPEG